MQCTYVLFFLRMADGRINLKIGLTLRKKLGKGELFQM